MNSPATAKAFGTGPFDGPALLFPGGAFSQTAVLGPGPSGAHPARAAPSGACPPGADAAPPGADAAPPGADAAPPGAEPVPADPRAEPVPADPRIHPALRAELARLLLAEKQDAGAALSAKLERLDAVLFCSLLPLPLQPFFLALVEPAHLPGRGRVQDIGHIVRRMLLRSSSGEILFRMYSHSMPFVKHNRLQFPPFEHVALQDMQHMLAAIQNLTLGSAQGVTKMPVWTTRRQLMAFFHELLTRGSAMDLYVFLSSHLYLLRLALIEYFIVFTNRYMPLEVSLMRWFIDRSYDHARVSRLVRYIVDNFRISALQEDLDFARLETKAQTAIERCNRTCRSMQNFHHVREGQRNAAAHEPAFAAAMRAPRLAGLHGLGLLAAARTQPLLALAAVHDLQTRVVRFPLPVELQLQQYNLIRDSKLEGLKHRSLLYVCLRCHEQHPTAAGNMRLIHGQPPLCVNCLSNAFTVCVQTLGCIVRVRSTSYYFCRFCASVHAWDGSAVAFYQCARSASGQTERPARPAPAQGCVVCLRAQGCSAVTVFDPRLGVRTPAWLCGRHMPPAAQLEYAHDITALRELLRCRFA